MYPRVIKPIQFTTRLGPNFLWHMLAAARIGYNSDYADRYEHTIEPSDLAHLKCHAELLRFGSGAGGDLAAFFSTFAGWLHLEAREDFSAYFEALDTTLSERNFAPIRKAFPHMNWSDPMVGPSLDRWEFPNDTSRLRSVLADLAGIYLRAYDRYVAEVWPEAQAAMSPRVEELTRHFDTQDYIALWENHLKLCFRAPVYEIVVCFANKGGPDYNSLGYNGNLIFYDKPFDRTWQLISHEIGTHLLIDSVLTLSNDEKYDWPKLYGAYEVMAMFYNRRVLGLQTLAYDLNGFDQKRLLPFYERASCTETPPVELLRQAADWFCRAATA